MFEPGDRDAALPPAPTCAHRVGYDRAEDARDALAAIQRRRRGAKRTSGPPGRRAKPLRVVACACGRWHIGHGGGA